MRPLASLTDEELVRRFRAGIEADDAFMELHERYHAATCGFLRRRIGVAEIAAEENQELYLSVLQNLEGFRGECSFRTWLFRIAHHRLSHLRRRWGVHVDERTEEAPEALWDAIAAPAGQDPERRAAKGQVSASLRRCLAALPEIERAVVFGQYFGGITLKMLSREMDLANPSGARALLIAAQRKLRQCLQKAGLDAATALGALEEGR